jgi:protein-disulfide isomerase
MLRFSIRFAGICLAGIAALVCLSWFAIQAGAQQKASSASAQETSSKVLSISSSAATPTKETVNAFLTAEWGYIKTRTWEIQAIEKTSVAGLSKVFVLVTDKGEKEETGQLVFFAFPDGKHILIAGNNELMTFGEHPFEEARAILQQQADGPYLGSASKDFELVEFADLQCPLCAEKQPDMEKLAADFPNARIVFQNYPLESIHPASFRSAAYGVCVNKEGGSSAFFKFASTVFENQAGLATTDGATLTLNSAVTNVGLDPAKIAACAATPEVRASITASEKLAKDLDIGQSGGQIPSLVVNGRVVIMGNVPYETLKQMVEYQARLDGVAD